MSTQQIRGMLAIETLKRMITDEEIETVLTAMPDMYGRPWGQLWERYFEQGMEKPQDEDIFSFE